VLYTGKNAENPNPELLKLVHDGIGFQLYQVRKDRLGYRANGLTGRAS
jgi:hypothetical protein